MDGIVREGGIFVLLANAAIESNLLLEAVVTPVRELRCSSRKGNSTSFPSRIRSTVHLLNDSQFQPPHDLFAEAANHVHSNIPTLSFSNTSQK